tara:strand:- start:50 stop:526 length:477 start_codon:yes stop_codon:yes gene_type:complete
MSIEERLVDNLIVNYDKANNNKVYVEGIIGEDVELELDETKSVYVWECESLNLKLLGKCNHVFIYKGDGITIRIEDCVSGVTCMNSSNCNILINVIPEYNIEVSNSDRINIRSSFFDTNIVHKSVEMNIIKSINCRVSEYYNVNDGMLSRWHCNYFNF